MRNLLSEPFPRNAQAKPLPQLLSDGFSELELEPGVRLALESELGLGLALGLRLGLVVGPELDSGSGWGWGQRWGREVELEVGLGSDPAALPAQCFESDFPAFPG